MCPTPDRPKRVLILCTGNSCRSQMAEGLWRGLGGSAWEVFSAGSRPVGYVHPLAIRVMQEIGIDLGAHASKPVSALADQPFDVVVTVCDGAREACPTFPGAPERHHWPFEDPASAGGGEEERLRAFREVREAIRSRIRRYLAGGA
ncbi:MAG: arsenate reductase ArsC [Phycisphaerae bacterium]